jgi:hypothetical protein
MNVENMHGAKIKIFVKVLIYSVDEISAKLVEHL